jgi:hypothetical protein
MFVYRSKASIDAMAAAAALTASDLATVDAGGGATKVLALSMAGLRFLAWTTALNGQPGLNLDVPAAEVAIVQANMYAAKNALGTAWPQT